MSIFKKLSNFKNSFEGGAPNNGFTNETIRTAVDLWIRNRDQAIRQYGDINTWNVSQVTDMNQLFRNRSTFNDDISNWDVGNVTRMEEMFYEARAFNQPLGGWNVGNVTTMEKMFFQARAFNQPLEQWNIGNETDWYGMFNSSGISRDNKPPRLR